MARTHMCIGEGAHGRAIEGIQVRYLKALGAPHAITGWIGHQIKISDVCLAPTVVHE
jgi:hypothetical protein